MEDRSLSDRSPRYFIGYTDETGWQIFSRGLQRTFGFTEAKRSAAEKLNTGDLIICYLRGVSAWCGVIEVAPPSSTPDSIAPDRLAAYPVRVPVRPLVILPVFNAITMTEGDEVWNSLSLTRGKTRSPGWNARFRSDLARLPVEDGDYLARAIRARNGAPLGAEAADTDEGGADDREDDREWVNRQIVARRGQRAFREQLMAAYGRRCAVSRCTVPDILEAAHVTRYLGPKSNRMTNGLLLRADLHTLYDCGLLAFDPVTRAVMLAPALRGSEYEAFAGVILVEASPPDAAPSREAMQDHLDDIFLPTRRIRGI
jgi:hypothetical protein